MSALIGVTFEIGPATGKAACKVLFGAGAPNPTLEHPAYLTGKIYLPAYIIDLQASLDFLGSDFLGKVHAFRS